MIFEGLVLTIESPPLGLGPLGPRIDWASRGTFAVLASELNCKGNQASRDKFEMFWDQNVRHPVAS